MDTPTLVWLIGAPIVWVTVLLLLRHDDTRPGESVEGEDALMYAVLATILAIIWPILAGLLGIGVAVYVTALGVFKAQDYLRTKLR